MNRKRSLIYKLLLIVVVVSTAIFVIYRYTNKKPNVKNLLGKLREQNKAGFDSLQQAINYENDLDYRIKKCINDEDYTTAYSLIDSLPSFGRTHAVSLYKGMIYDRQKNYTAAIREYTHALNEIRFSKARSLRANAYLKMNNLDSAMYDYKEAYSLNYEYSLQIASIFESMNKKDSALKYYQIYLKHNPTDKIVQEKVKLLIPRLK